MIHDELRAAGIHHPFVVAIEVQLAAYAAVWPVEVGPLLRDHTTGFVSQDMAEIVAAAAKATSPLNAIAIVAGIVRLPPPFASVVARAINEILAASGLSLTQTERAWVKAAMTKHDVLFKKEEGLQQ